MYNFSRELKDYHDQHITLSQEQQKEMRERRNCNRSRIANGVDEKFAIGDPASFVIQGSYDMRTMIQDEKSDYDIDDGVKIHKDRLVDNYGTPYTQMVSKSIIYNVFRDDKRFSTPPSIHKNCVRIKYNEGYHIDIPVYRYSTDSTGKEILELASDVWEITDPKGVTNWFNTAVTNKSPDDNKDQMREIVRLLKMLVKKHKNGNDLAPSGFVVSKLVDEVYGNVDKARLDTSFVGCCELIIARLKKNLEVEHPVLNGVMLVDRSQTSKTRFFMELLDFHMHNFRKNLGRQHETHYENNIDSWGQLFKATDEFKAIAKKYIGPSNLSSTLKEVTKVGGAGGYA